MYSIEANNKALCRRFVETVFNQGGLSQIWVDSLAMLRQMDAIPGLRRDPLETIPAAPATTPLPASLPAAVWGSLNVPLALPALPVAG